MEFILLDEENIHVTHEVCYELNVVIKDSSSETRQTWILTTIMFLFPIFSVRLVDLLRELIYDI